MRKGLALRSPLRRGGGGFTLLEVLAVVVILAVFASMIFALMSFVESTRIRDAEIRVHGLGIEVSKYAAQKGFPPPTLEVLAPSLDRAGWMSGGKFVDTWDRPFEYVVVGKEFTLRSCGRDGVAGTPDDLRYKNK